MISDRALKSFLAYAPANWVLVRIPECELLSQVKLKEPVLDVGCGDGYFAKILLSERKQKCFDSGVDFSKEEIKRAVKNKVYKRAVQGDIKSLPFKNEQFGSAFSNGTLEHVDNIDLALKEISRVIKKGGIFAFTVPSKYLGSYLFFSFVPGYKNFFNNIFGHVNLFDHKQWERLLIKNSFKLSDYSYYNTKTQIKLHDLLCWWAIPAFFCKTVLGRWIIFSQLRQVTSKIELPILKKIGEPVLSKKAGGSLFIIAQKI